VALGQVSQHVAALLAAGGDRAQHPLDEPAPRLAVGPAADPPPDDSVRQGALGRVGRRLDAINPREGPQALPEPQQLAARRRRIYDERAFDRLAELADALQDVGCDDAAFLAHCREPGEHARGCWVVDKILGRA
jgi:hypothetical protein